MSNAPQQIGQYHVQSELGRGGMGVVYLAHDSRLDRQVAIKALPSEVTVDAERLARFEREARTLAQLNHPNLAGIHGVEVVDDQRFLVLEYVEGETLADVLERGPLPIDDALQLCAQIAAGVESAHDGGVIHRDLKPANIKITPDGKVKVLDFGLAKSTDPVSSTTNSQFPTQTTPHNQQSHTIEGAILGTAPYMSPEQARGRRVDRRSDVWSFGCILYECLTGARLFAGETATDSMGAILHKEIDFSLLPRATPQRVRELLSRLLERDKDRRLRDLGDAMLELEAARGEPGPEHVGSGSSGQRGPGWPIAMALVALAAIVTGAVVWWLAGTTGEHTIVSQGPPKFMLKRLTDAAGVENWPTLSPDGSVVVFAANDDGDTDIFTRRVDGLNATNLTPDHDGDDAAPALSPDGRLIAFVSERDGGGIFVMGATGESPRRLTSTGFDPAWSPDGTRLVYATEPIFAPLSRMSISRLYVVNIRSGAVELLYEGDAVQPSWSPSGERIAFWRVHKNGQRDLVTIKADGTDPVEVMNDPPTDWRPVWSPDGRWLYYSSNRGGEFGIWRISIDEPTGMVSGEPQQVTTGLAVRTGFMAMAGNGRRLAFVATRVTNQVMRQDLDPSTGEPVGEPRSITPFSTLHTFPVISPDGSHIAYANSGENQEDLFTISSDGEGRRRVTNDTAKDRGPQWMPDGSRLLFYSDRDGRYRIWTVRPDGGDLRVVTSTEETVTSPALSPDGSLLAVSSSSGNAMFLFRITEDGTATPLELPPAPDGKTNLFPLRWSPDSRKLLVAWAARGDTDNPILLFDLDTNSYKPIEALGRTRNIAFSADGGAILYTNSSSHISRLDLETGETSLFYEVPGFVANSFFSLDRFDVARDGSWFCYMQTDVQSDLWMLEFQDQ